MYEVKGEAAAGLVTDEAVYRKYSLHAAPSETLDMPQYNHLNQKYSFQHSRLISNCMINKNTSKHF